ncbi:hypothetical protein, partial [Shigella sonnei]|uniref:hypothetical protein n=1 Tax=Shigella sonnei TaxID=624 RepID=UPI00069C9958
DCERCLTRFSAPPDLENPESPNISKEFSCDTRMIGFMSDQMLETAPRLTRAVSDETSVYAGAGQNIGQNPFNIINVICAKEHI